jgi:hypothetical protein
MVDSFALCASLEETDAFISASRFKQQCAELAVLASRGTMALVASSIQLVEESWVTFVFLDVSNNDDCSRVFSF